MELYNDDCLNIMKTMKDKSVDIIFTDPPYALGSSVIIKKDGKPDYNKAVDFIGIELNKEYFEIAKARIENAKIEKKGLF